jgi:hypothetical protein
MLLTRMQEMTSDRVTYKESVARQHVQQAPKPLISERQICRTLHASSESCEPSLRRICPDSCKATFWKPS